MQTKCIGWGIAVIVMLLGAMQGCASQFSETHFFRTVDEQGRPANYFKIEIDGGTFLSSSRYISGYFDEQAVDTYFGEFTQPSSFNGSSTTPSPSQPASQAPANGTSPPATTVQSLDGPGLQGKKLILLFSSNSDQIATEIGNLGQGNDVVSTLSQVIGKDKAAALQKKQAQAQADQAASTQLVNQGNSTILAWNSATPPAAAQSDALNYANQLARYLGNKQDFPNLTAAKDWVAKNGVQVILEDKP